VTRRSLVLASVLFLVSCSARQPSAPAAESSAAPTSGEAMSAPSEPGTMVEEEATVTLVGTEEFLHLVEIDQELDAMLLGTPDCPRACEHLAALCDLAERICSLAVQEPDREVDGQCADGRARCTKARERAQTACTCR
jgi:hypothetical protein